MGLGNILRTLRKSYNYSQQYVAKCLNISRNAYIAWENGDTQINMKKLQQVCEVYQITLQELLIHGDKPKTTSSTNAKRVRKKQTYLSTSREITNF